MLEWRFSEREFSGGSLGSISIIFHLTGKQQIKAFFVISSQPYELELYRISPPKYCSPVHQNDDEVWTLSMRAKTINDQFFKFRITDVSMKKFQRWRRTIKSTMSGVYLNNGTNSKFKFIFILHSNNLSDFDNLEIFFN